MRNEETPIKKDSRAVVVVSAIFWIISLLSGTGIGKSFDLYGKMIAFLMCFLIYQMLFEGRFRKVKKTTMVFILIIIGQNIYTNIAYGQDFLQYVAIYTIPLLYSLFKVDEKQMRMIGLIYGIGGGAVLLVANYTKYFAGWDGNGVSLIGFFSYAVFIASLSDIRREKHQQYIIVYSCIYFILLWTLNSRSCILFSIVLLFCELGLLPIRSIITKSSILFLLIVPLIIAVIVISINNAGFINRLNEWSIEVFHKALFNGRDDMWSHGLIMWMKYPLLGNGTFQYNWHNSAIACLVGAGSVGYFIWIYMIRNVLSDACTYINDNVIFGTVTAFLIVWLQQSVEQGLVSTRGTPVIFVLLGLILARTNTLKQNEEKMLGEQEDV